MSEIKIKALLSLISNGRIVVDDIKDEVYKQEVIKILSIKEN